MKKLLLTILIVLLAVSFVGCDLSLFAPTGKILPTAIKLSQESTAIAVGESLALTAKIYPLNATDKSIAWTSSNAQCATVDQNGKIVGLSAGTTTIKATSIAKETVFGECSLTVTGEATVPPVPPTPVAVTSMEITPTTLQLEINQSSVLSAIVLPSDADNKNVTWTSSNQTIATVLSNGLVTGLSVGIATIQAISQENSSIFGECQVTVTQTVVEDSPLLQLNQSNCAVKGNYSSNFGINTVNGVDFVYYRAKGNSTDIGKFYAYSSLSSKNDGSLSGAFYNVEAIDGITELEIEYKSGGNVKVSSGLGLSYTQMQVLPSATAYTKLKVVLTNPANYFMVETTTADMTIKSVDVKYGATTTKDYAVDKTADLRIEPTVFSGTLVDGESKVTVPNEIAIDYETNTYVVTSTKTYTYYSYNYVYNNKNSLDLSQIAMTDPVDVANYFIAFGQIPANYGTINSNKPNSTLFPCGTESQVNSLFGDDARGISAYSRTDGYATSVPYKNYNSTGKPYYFEFDVDLDGSYSTDSRGVGRVVMWLGGWSGVGYDSSPVATLTTDHYYTFQEYLGYGQFGTFFDGFYGGEYIYRTNCSRKGATTITLTPSTKSQPTAYNSFYDKKFFATL